MNNLAKTYCRALHAGFFDRAEFHPDDIALDFGNRICKYGELSMLSLRIANTIETCRNGVGMSKWVGILANKTIQGYASILGILCSGKGYLPLSCDAPISQLVDMIERSKTKLLLVDEDGVELLSELLAQFDRPLTICLVADSDSAHLEVRLLREKFKQHAFANVSSVAKDLASLNIMVQRETPAYLLFTSGNTGRPKGVVVSHGNVRHFLDFVIVQFAFTSKDRFSQNFEFTFDLSVFDIFVSLEVGACICPPSAGYKFFPNRYIKRSRLTVWFSLPSAVNSMLAAQQLSSDIFCGLRYSLFCGEPLAVKAARLWHNAAGNSELVNLYGSTEATICCTAYTWDPLENKYEDECIVPIGRPFWGSHVKVLDEKLLPVTDGQIGELWVGGPQVALGYLDDLSETQLQFAYDEELKSRFYRTGDKGFYDVNRDHLCFLGKVEHPVKIDAI